MRPGKISRKPDGYMVEFERTFDHPIGKVWDALTNPDVLKIWFTEVEMDFREGGRIVFYFADDARSSSLGEIVTIKKPHLFEFTWETELARWELEEKTKSSCTLKLTYSKISKDYATKAPAGFHIILDQLGEVLDGRVERYPLGATTDDPLQKKMESMYADLAADLLLD